MRDLMNRGRRRRTVVDLKDKQVELVSITPHPTLKHRYYVIANIDGWPHTLSLWGKDELDIMRQIVDQRDGNSNNPFMDVSK